MRSHTLKLHKLESHTKGDPIISIVGSGRNTFLWVGQQDKDLNLSCFSFTKAMNTSAERKALKQFAKSLLKRLEAK